MAAEDIVCFCNKVSRAKIEHVIKNGANSLSAIYDACGAGTGPCGGSCRASLREIMRSLDTPQADSAPSEEIPLPLVKAISLFNRRYYWECHEVLENLWMAEYGKPRLFYQGIIQASAALYHVLNSNPKGVVRLAQEAQNKLKAYSPSFLSIPVDELINSLGHYIEEARDILGGTTSGFNYDLLPQIQIGPAMELRPKNSTS